MLGVGPVAWQSHKSKSVHLSSSESEFYSLSEIAQELTWFKSLMTDLSITFYPVVVYEDNANVINWIKDKASRARTKILGSRLNYVREAEAFGLIKLQWISSDDQVADMFTKPLGKEKLYKFVTQVGVSEISG